MDGFRTAEMWSGEQKGMRRRGPRPGMPNAADPATVLQRGFSVRSAVSGGDGSQVRPASRKRQAGKATGVAARSAGAGRLFLYESSALSCCRQALGRRGESDGFQRPRPASQETCHPRAWCPHWGGLPVASTEVVVATFCISGSLRPRRCPAISSVQASIPVLCILHPSGAADLHADGGIGTP